LVIALNLAGGAYSSLPDIEVLLSAIVKTIIPAVDQMTKQEVFQQYSGTFVSGTSSSVELSVGDGGLLVSNFSINGVDVAAGLAAYLNAASTSIHLYPAGLLSGNQTSWRAVYTTQSVEEMAQFEAQMFIPQASCQTWFSIDGATYGLEGLDHFTITVDEKGRAVAIELKAWRIKLIMREE